MATRRAFGLSLAAAVAAGPAGAAMPFIPGMGEWRLRAIRIVMPPGARNDGGPLREALAEAFADRMAVGDRTKPMLTVRIDRLDLTAQGDEMRGIGALTGPQGQKLGAPEIVVSAPPQGDRAARIAELSRRFARGLKGGLGL